MSNEDYEEERRKRKERHRGVGRRMFDALESATRPRGILFGKDPKKKRLEA